ncbi:hypothetical protein GCM10007923_64030 [Shinella yambaruensis]|uniref:Uncharacterized protein n=1 Tax=Shinella yambaruensis TaxID=415996 RepID=A0ABQ5ZVR7_9HYPH|nr:hypothetical protein GCM10007923_64030 [Shinella yambaruensis]
MEDAQRCGRPPRDKLGAKGLLGRPRENPLRDEWHQKGRASGARSAGGAETLGMLPEGARRGRLDAQQGKPDRP